MDVASDGPVAVMSMRPHDTGTGGQQVVRKERRPNSEREPVSLVIAPFFVEDKKSSMSGDIEFLQF
jgi:hypothetical protein